MTLQEALKQAAIAHLTANPQEIDPKFQGDPVKAAESVYQGQAALTQAQQALAAQNAQLAALRNQSAGGTNPMFAPANNSSFNWNEKILEEIRNTGTISAATRNGAIQAGISAGFVDSLVGMATTQQTVVQTLTKTVFGADYDKITQWVGTLPAAVQNQIRDQLAGPGAEFALYGLKAQYAATQGAAGQQGGTNQVQPQSVFGGVRTSAEPANIYNVAPGVPASQPTQFNTLNDLQQAAMDPRFKTDPKFKADVLAARDRINKQIATQLPK